MKFEVCYDRPKKKKGFYSKQSAVFYDIRDAMLWERHLKTTDAKNIILRVK